MTEQALNSPPPNSVLNTTPSGIHPSETTLPVDLCGIMDSVADYHIYRLPTVKCIGLNPGCSSQITVNPAVHPHPWIDC